MLHLITYKSAKGMRESVIKINHKGEQKSRNENEVEGSASIKRVAFPYCTATKWCCITEEPSFSSPVKADSSTQWPNEWTRLKTHSIKNNAIATSVKYMGKTDPNKKREEQKRRQEKEKHENKLDTLSFLYNAQAEP